MTPLDAITKKCSYCGNTYPLDFFRKAKTGKYGYSSECKLCARERERIWRTSHREKEKARHKKYREEHKEAIKKYREEHRESVEHKDYFAEKREAFRRSHPNYYSEYFRIRHKDPIKKLEDQVRGTIRSSFMRKGYRKTTKSAALTGMTSTELTEYLLTTFSQNYGREWDGKEDVHIDHITPLSTAKTEDDVKRLCHYSNLQLLTAEDNRRKHSKEKYDIAE